MGWLGLYPIDICKVPPHQERAKFSTNAQIEVNYVTPEQVSVCGEVRATTSNMLKNVCVLSVA